MAATAITLYPFIPPEPDCEKAVQFSNSGGFTKKWSDGDLSGLRFGSAYFPLQKIDVLEREQIRWPASKSMISSATGKSCQLSNSHSFPGLASRNRRIIPGNARFTSSVQAAAAATSERMVK